jgi:pyruvate/2-oxoglutarate dehydrogenase complex dihydrolipoamide dehydrogenase (E3) component
MFDVIVIGAGPAGVVAALRAGDLGAKTGLITRDQFGGMAANDGPVPVRTLAHAARLIRDISQLGRYGISIGEPALDYSRLLERVREVTCDVRAHSSLRKQIDSANVQIFENSGVVRFSDPQTIAAMAAGMPVDDLAAVPLSYPTYAGAVGRVAASATRQLNVQVDWRVSQVES